MKDSSPENRGKFILTLYEKYHTMPNLQMHQLRVAAVAAQICDSLSIPISTSSVVRVSLFHDMGNIIKFDLEYFPDFVQPEGLAYWQAMQDTYIAKYGTDEHVATLAICKEIGFTEHEIGYLKDVGFTRAPEVLKHGSIESLVCCYADQRVGPHGMLTLHERFADGEKRYEGRADKSHTLKKYDACKDALTKIEKKIFAQSSITPESITDASIMPLIEKMKAGHL